MMTRPFTGFMTRLPIDLHEKIKAAAAANGRSMNAEIIHRLSLEPDALSERIARLEAWAWADKEIDIIGRAQP